MKNTATYDIPCEYDMNKETSAVWYRLEREKELMRSVKDLAKGRMRSVKDLAKGRMGLHAMPVALVMLTQDLEEMFRDSFKGARSLIGDNMFGDLMSIGYHCVEWDVIATALLDGAGSEI